jgi:hypothetical protein
MEQIASDSDCIAHPNGQFNGVEQRDETKT